MGENFLRGMQSNQQTDILFKIYICISQYTLISYLLSQFIFQKFRNILFKIYTIVSYLWSQSIFQTLRFSVPIVPHSIFYQYICTFYCLFIFCTRICFVYGNPLRPVQRKYDFIKKCSLKTSLNRLPQLLFVYE